MMHVSSLPLCSAVLSMLLVWTSKFNLCTVVLNSHFRLILDFNGCSETNLPLQMTNEHEVEWQLHIWWDLTANFSSCGCTKGFIHALLFSPSSYSPSKAGCGRLQPLLFWWR